MVHPSFKETSFSTTEQEALYKEVFRVEDEPSNDCQNIDGLVESFRTSLTTMSVSL